MSERKHLGIRNSVRGAALLGLALIAACATSQATTRQDPVQPGSSLLGNYLAARHAQSERRADLAARFFEAVLADDPSVPGVRVRTFELLAMEGRIEDALVLARALESTGSAVPLTSLALVFDALARGDFTAALTRVESLPVKGLNQFMRPLLHAWALQGVGRTDEALADLDALGKTGGFKTLAALHRAMVAEAAGRFDVADAAYAETLRSGSPASRLWALRGAFLERRGRIDEARKLYETYLAEHPDNRVVETARDRLARGLAPLDPPPGPAVGVADALFDIANSMRQRNARDTAMVLARFALYLRPGFDLMQILVADLLEYDDRLGAANEIYRRVGQQSHVAWTARLGIATNLDRLERTEEAVRELRRLAADYPREPDPLISLGDILRSNERFTEAADAYTDALARIADVRPEHWTLFYTRGIARERAKNWDSAEADFLKALDLHPDQSYVLNYLGYSWVDRGINLDRARTMIEKAVAAQPNDGYIVDSLGWVLYRFGEYRDAVRHLERAVELRPHDPVINDHLGDAYWKVNRNAEARFQWRRAAGLDPEPDLLRRIENKIRHGLTPDTEI